jgi:2-polyprenyl-6-hydroxyphenyl methylase/3-demethylubiquinone-9 3-methyltransferase
MSSASGDDHLTCKICGCATKYIGVLDANKCCQDRLGSKMLPVSGINVPYFVCSNCGFIFTNYMDNWTPDDFKAKIYNRDYDRINPPIPGRTDVPLKETPSYAAGVYIASIFEGSQSDTRILDFGSGGDPGPTGQALIDAGFQVHSYDPYRANGAQFDGRFDIIIAIEVLEHCHDFASVTRILKSCAARDGIVWIQTLIHPHPAPIDVLDSWYISPRDGHISIHTQWSLTLLFSSIGMNVVQTARGMFAFRNLPAFPNKLFIN